MTEFKSNLCLCTTSRSQPITNAVALKDLLPVGYDYNLCDYEETENGFISRFRINIITKEDALQWLEEFSYLSKTTFRTNKVYPQNTVGNIYKVSKYCHHNTKSYPAQQIKSKRHTACSARLVLTVKQTTLSRKYKSKDVHLKDYPTIIFLHYTHNHPVDSADALKFRRPTEEVKEKYFKMFIAGYTPSKAYNKFNSELRELYDDQYHIIAADGALNPNMKWVYYTYYNVFKKKYEEASGKIKVESIAEFVKKCKSDKKGNFVTVKHLPAEDWFSPLHSNDSEDSSDERFAQESSSKNRTSEAIIIKVSKCEVDEQPDNEAVIQEFDSIVSKSNVDEQPDNEVVIQEFDSIVKNIIEKAKSNPEMINAMKKFNRNAKNLKTDIALQSALSTFGKYGGLASGGKICVASSKRLSVQPTTLAKRKVKYDEQLAIQSERPPKHARNMEHGYSKN